ncbi:MAG: SH3 domain-containing protein [Anaerolinea sp.]|nr:SH3 domain-containing protein [Anaerolinea sp.]
MKKVFLLLIVLATSGVFAHPPHFQTTPYQVASSSRINVRAEPNTDATVVTQLDPGTQVDVTGHTEGETLSGNAVWLIVSIPAGSGYVHSSLLRPADSGGVPAGIEVALAASPPRGVPANPNADRTARAVLRYLNTLPERGDNRVVSGQFGAFGDGTSRESAEQQVQEVFDESGHYPALTGMDYKRWDMMNGNDFSEPNGFLIDYWNAGGLVNLSWHANNPWTGGSSNDWENPNTSDPWDTRPVTELLMLGNPAAIQWRAMLDNIASGLQELEDAGVVVIWRPLHEMNGGWAWWHRQDPEAFKALWRDMFDYFTYEKGLNNLLWAYTPMMNGSDFDPSPAVFYPGGGYVDFVGLDKYMNIGEDPLNLNRRGEYDAIRALDKPIGLFEFGPIPASGEGWDGPRYNYANLIRDIRDLYPEVVLFQAWEYVWQIGWHDNAAGLMTDPWVITRDELPGF